MTHTLEGREAAPAAVMGAILSSSSAPEAGAARGAVMIISTPLGTALGGPLVGAIGAATTSTASGVATVLLAAGAALMWPRSLVDATNRMGDE